LHAREEVVDQLDQSAAPDGTEVYDRLSHRLECGTESCETRIGAADEEEELALRRLDLAPRHRRIHELAADARG
jgi:hypothetical protein